MLRREQHTQCCAQSLRPRFWVAKSALRPWVGSDALAHGTPAGEKFQIAGPRFHSSIPSSHAIAWATAPELWSTTRTAEDSPASNQAGLSATVALAVRF